MKDLGGYFSLERLPTGDGITLPADGHLFASGRQALAHWLAARGVTRLHVPGWICPAVPDAAARVGADVACYHLGPDLMPQELPSPAPGHGLLLLNPFGLGDDIPGAGEWPAEQVIVDDTMDFFRGTRGNRASFNSWRKFLPVTDGATLCDGTLSGPGERPSLAPDDSYLRRRAEEGAAAAYADYRAHEEAVEAWPEAGPSVAARATLARLDGTAIRRCRRRNFLYLQAALGQVNALPLPNLEPDATPLAYPFLPATGSLHEKLWERRIWVARLWGEDPRLKTSAWEKRLARDLLPLAVDHRWDEADMDRVATLVLKLVEETA